MTTETSREAELRIHALGAAISRRDWPAVEQVHAAIRDEFHARRSTATAGSAVAVKELEWLQPMDTFVKGDGIYVTHAYIHEGCVIVFMGTNAKPFGWMDAHAFFKDKVYRDQLLPVALDAPPPSPVVSEAMVERAAEAFFKRTGGKHVGRRDFDDAMRAALNAALSHAPAGEVGWRPTHRHVKSGRLYQSTGTRINATNSANGQVMVDYCDQRGQKFCREQSEFHDGRFQALPASPTGGDK